MKAEEITGGRQRVARRDYSTHGGLLPTRLKGWIVGGIVEWERHGRNKQGFVVVRWDGFKSDTTVNLRRIELVEEEANCEIHGN